MKKFFAKKFTVLCLIMYLLTTAFIYSSSFKGNEDSKRQSLSISNLISNVIEFFSNDKVVLKDEGKDKTLYPETIDVQISSEMFVGKIWKTSAKFKPDGNYTLSTIVYSSSNESVFTVDEDGVITPIAPGTATLTVEDSFSKISTQKQITVTDEVYVPKVTFTPMEETPYFSSGNGASGVYSIDYKYEVAQNKLTADYDETECDVTLGKDQIFFYPKKSGAITFNVVTTFDNLNGKNQTHSYPFTVNVTEKAMPSFNKDFALSSTTVDMRTSEAGVVSTNYTEFASGLDDTQKRIFFVNNNKHLKVYLDGDDVKFESTKVGTATVKLYYPTASGLKSQTVNVTITQGVPKEMKIVATNDYAILNSKFTLSVVGDGEVFKTEDFIWTTDNGKVYNNGFLFASERGKATVTVKHKTVEGFTVSATFPVKLSYATYVRKIVGHTGLFFIHAFFGFVVFYRLIEVLKPLMKKRLGSILTFASTVITAGLSEFFQSGLFTDGRTPTFTDVLIDAFGGALAIAFWLILLRWKEKRNNKKQIASATAE